MTCNNENEDLSRELNDIKFRVREFTTPLVALQQLLNSLQKVSPGDIRNWISPIKTNNRRLLESINNVLLCSEENAPVIMTSINLKELIEQIHEDLLPDAEDKKLNLKLEICAEEDEMWVFGNFKYLKHGIWNLIDNSIKFTQFGTIKITLSISRIDKKRVITISDTGCGIKPEYQKVIFDRYRPHPLSGLGLHVTQAIAQQHGGSLVLLESKLGQGTTFELSLPAAS